MLTNDVDLLVAEPGLFGVWRIAHQQRCKGSSGTLSGTAFSAVGAEFVAAGVQAGDVLYLASVDGAIDGCYEIVEAVSASQLTVSMVRGDAALPAVPVGAGSSLIWRINTFAPQRTLAETMLLDRLDLSEEDIANLTDVSRRRLTWAVVAVAMVLIFESLVQLDGDDELFGRKKDVYQQALEEAMVKLRLDTDADGDGLVEALSRGDTVQLERN